MAKCSLLFLLAIPAVLGLLVPSCMADNVLYTDESLYTGQSLTYGAYYLVMQTDCNLVLYDAGKPIWATDTGGLGSDCHATMQSDGNLVVYSSRGNSVWASNTNRNTDYYVLVLQKDRNLVIYGPAIWATATNAVGTPGVVVASNATTTAVPVVVAAAADEGLGSRKIAMVTKN